MIKKLIRVVFTGKEKPKTDFSRFVYYANATEKKKVVKKAIAKANKEQAEIVRQYEHMCAAKN